MTYELELPCHIDSPARARRFLADLAHELPSWLIADLRLLVSELVTNALRHGGVAAGDSIGLRVDLIEDARVRVEVRDPGRAGAPAVRRPAPGQAGGWGLYLVERLADRWGVDRNDHTRVWFEMS